MRRVAWTGVVVVVALLGGCGDDDTLPRTTNREPSATTSVGAERIEYQPGVYLSLVDREGCEAGARPAMVTLDATIADDFAARGYLGVVVEARDPGHGTQFDAQMLRSIRSVVHDLGIAVQWLRAHAEEHCVAPDAIAATGYSFGALTALALAYSEGEEPASISIDEFGRTVPVERDELDPVPADLADYSNDVDGVVAFAGFALPEHLDAGEPPMILFHGRDDGVIPFSLAEATCVAARSVDVECELVSLAAEHGIDVHASALLDPAERFLAREMLAPAGLGAG